jgi:hypothetical protein
MSQRLGMGLRPMRSTHLAPVYGMPPALSTGHGLGVAEPGAVGIAI